jgi:hypothetical protein
MAKPTDFTVTPKQTPPPKAKEPEVKTFAFRLTKTITPISPGEPPYQPFKQLPPASVCYDEATGGQRVVRVLEGVNTFWEDEQVEKLKISPSVAASREWRPTFVDGFLLLRSPQDDLKIAAMKARDEFDGKTIRMSGGLSVYTLDNKEVEFKSKRELQQLEKKATDYALAAKYEEIIAHANFLGIKLTDGYGEKRKEDDVLAAYYEYAKAKPDLFLKSFDSPVVKMKHIIKEAITDGTIDLGHVRGQAHWGETKALITVIDMKKDAVEELSDFAFSDKEGADDFVKRLNK